MRTYLISWTYADKLHTFSLHYKITKTSNKTGFTQFCYSFKSHYIFLFGKSQIIFLSFYTHPMFHHICNFQRKPSYDCVKWSYYTYYWVLPTFQPVAYNCLLVSTLDPKKTDSHHEKYTILPIPIHLRINPRFHLYFFF